MGESNTGTFAFLSENYDYFNLDVNYLLQAINSGIGLHGSISSSYSVNDKLGLRYAYRYSINDEIQVGIGTDLQLIRVKFPSALEAVYYSNPPEDYKSSYLAGIDLGIWLRINKLNFGFSSKNCNNPSHTFYLDSVKLRYEIPRYYTVVLNYNFQLGPEILFRNSAIAYFNNPLFLLMLQNEFVINQRLIFGLSTSKSGAYYSIVPNLGFTLFEDFDILFALRVFTTERVQDGSMSMEALVNYRF